VYDEVMKSDSKLRRFALIDAEWCTLRLVRGMLEPFAMATNMVSRARCVSTGLAFVTFEYLMRKLEGFVLQRVC
jgi:hypothetical protein